MSRLRWYRWLFAPACVLALLACGADSTTSPGSSAAGPPVAITTISGSTQSADAGTAFSQSLMVRVTDAVGKSVPSVVVTFTVSAGVASLSAPSALTDAQGQASASVMAGQTAGTVTITAQAAGVATPATF